MANVESDSAPKVMKKTLSRYAVGMSPPPKPASVEDLKKSDSDEEYGRLVEDPDIKDPKALKKSLSKYGVSPVLVKKLSQEKMRTSGDSDDEYGRLENDPDLSARLLLKKTLSKYGGVEATVMVVPDKKGDSDEEFGPLEPEVLDNPIDRKSISKFGSFQKKPVIVDPRADSPVEYGNLEKDDEALMDSEQKSHHHVKKVATHYSENGAKSESADWKVASDGEQVRELEHKNSWIETGEEKSSSSASFHHSESKVVTKTATSTMVRTHSSTSSMMKPNGEVVTTSTETIETSGTQPPPTVHTHHRIMTSQQQEQGSFEGQAYTDRQFQVQRMVAQQQPQYADQYANGNGNNNLLPYPPAVHSLRGVMMTQQSISQQQQQPSRPAQLIPPMQINIDTSTAMSPPLPPGVTTGGSSNNSPKELQKLSPSSPLITKVSSFTLAEDDPEVLLFMSRGYNREQAERFVLKKLGKVSSPRKSVMSPTAEKALVGASEIDESAYLAPAPEPVLPQQQEKEQSPPRRTIILSQSAHELLSEESPDKPPQQPNRSGTITAFSSFTNSSASASGSAKMLSVEETEGVDDEFMKPVEETTGPSMIAYPPAGATTTLTAAQERSVENLVRAGMSRPEAIIYIVGSSNPDNLKQMGMKRAGSSQQNMTTSKSGSFIVSNGLPPKISPTSSQEYQLQQQYQYHQPQQRQQMNYPPMSGGGQYPPPPPMLQQASPRGYPPQQQLYRQQQYQQQQGYPPVMQVPRQQNSNQIIAGSPVYPPRYPMPFYAQSAMSPEEVVSNEDDPMNCFDTTSSASENTSQHGGAPVMKRSSKSSSAERLVMDPSKPPPVSPKEPITPYTPQVRDLMEQGYSVEIAMEIVTSKQSMQVQQIQQQQQQQQQQQAMSGPPMMMPPRRINSQRSMGPQSSFYYQPPPPNQHLGMSTPPMMMGGPLPRYRMPPPQQQQMMMMQGGMMVPPPYPQYVGGPYYGGRPPPQQMPPQMMYQQQQSQAQSRYSSAATQAIGSAVGGTPDETEAMRITMLISQQEAEFGVNMYDVLTIDDETAVQQLVNEGYTSEDAVLIIFERKGYISAQPPIAVSAPVSQSGSRAGSRVGSRDPSPAASRTSPLTTANVQQHTTGQAASQQNNKSFTKFIQKKSMTKMKSFFGVPVGDHHKKKDVHGREKTEEERLVQKKFKYKDSDVLVLTNMGFTKEQAIQALISHQHNVHAAANALLSASDGGGSGYQQPQATAYATYR